MNQVKFRKLASGKIVKTLDEQYLRGDIPCGLVNCPLCDVNHNCRLRLEMKGQEQKKNVDVEMSDEDGGPLPDKIDKIFIIDHHFALNQIDLIENCDVLSNVVVIDSVLKHLNKINIQAFHGLRNVAELEDRQFYYFYNENCIETASEEQVKSLAGMGLDAKLTNKVFNVFLWYQRHFEGLTDGNKVFLLTSNAQTKQAYAELLNQQKDSKKMQSQVIDVNEFVTRHQDDFPELENFLGFSEQDEIDDDAEMRDESKQLYKEHAELSEMLLGIKEGRYFQGRLNVSRLTLDEGTVNTGGLKQELLIQSLADQNRALNGDIVAVEVLPKSKWIKNYKAAPLDFTMLNDEGEVNEAEAPEQATTLMQQINTTSSQVTARVIGVIKKMVKTYGGSILSADQMLDSTKEKLKAFQEAFSISDADIANHYRVFVPYNSQLSQVLVKSNSPEALENKRLIIRITKWPATSPFPFGQFVKIIGPEGKIRTETNMILHEFNVDMRPFSQKVLNCLPSEGKNWTPSEEEIARRWDLRHLDVCSVDPPGCKDIDDTLHCIILPNGNYEVGVHIADVTHFVRANSEIDKEAARRCTTVYMVDRRTDMLPGLLTENLCSLVSGVDRCAFSVIWEIDKDTLTKVNVKFGKSLIRSRWSGNYYAAQDMIDDKNDKSPLTESLRGLLKIARVLRDRRTQAGALSLASPELKFKLDNESQNPTDVSEYKHVDTHFMIEEFMLLGNVAVAERLADYYPTFAILRRHPLPKEKPLKDLVEQLAKCGMEVSTESSKKLADSLDKAIRPKDPFFNKLVRIMATRCMNQAVYFCMSTVDQAEIGHYGLAMAKYTHFTSPIRRYADVLVHRLLAATIDLQSLTNDMTDKFKMAKQCDQMNRKNRMAQLASGASVQFNTYLYFKNLQADRQQECTQNAVVMRIAQGGVYVMVQKYGLEGLLVVDDAVKKQVTVEMNVEKEEAYIIDQRKAKETRKVVKVFDNLDVEIRAEMVEYRRTVSLVLKMP